jgi:hypothetical protein
MVSKHGIEDDLSIYRFSGIWKEIFRMSDKGEVYKPKKNRLPLMLHVGLCEPHSYSLHLHHQLNTPSFLKLRVEVIQGRWDRDEANEVKSESGYGEITCMHLWCTHIPKDECGTFYIKKWGINGENVKKIKKGWKGTITVRALMLSKLYRPNMKEIEDLLIYERKSKKEEDYNERKKK